MGKKEKTAAGEEREIKDKEGRNLLGKPKFKKLENGRYRCVETGHEVPNAEAKAVYCETKHCRLGLIDAALAKKKPPLNMFEQDPALRSKLICQLTGDTINKSEEHIWKHINGKRFLHALEKKEAEKKTGGEAIEGEEQTPNSELKEDPVKEKKKDKKKKKKDKKKKKENDTDKANGEVMNTSDKERDSEDIDFWVPPDGERWDMDDGGDRWGSGSESESESDVALEPDEEAVANGADAAAADESKDEATELSKRTKRMSIEIETTGLVSKKKKKTVSQE